MNKITLGFEVNSGKKVEISPSHLIVTGITQLSGKTTTLEALISRSGLKAIVFKTKIGERSFTQGTEVPAFFRDRSDYEFVKSLIEAYAKEKLFLEKGTLMRLCKGASSLLDIKQKVDAELAGGKLRGLNQEIYTRLQHYLENLIPQIQYAPLSKTLQIYDGINIMNLERFQEEAQALIIQSVADEVLKTQHDVILVIPEAWKFLPQKYNNPCKRVVESFIRQGAANQNFVWIDSQDMAGVDKIPLKQISTWILGYQAERNEVKHTLDQISLPAKLKPKEDEIMTLKKGHFYLSNSEGMIKVYVQPVWIDEHTAKKIAQGTISVETVNAPNSLTPISRTTAPTFPQIVQASDSGLRKELVELRGDFFNKIQELQEAITTQATELYRVQSSIKPINDEEIISKVLQKIKPANANLEGIVQEVLKRIPASSGSIVYSVAPLEKLKKDFQLESKNRLVKEISELSDEEKKILKFIESQEARVNTTNVLDKCLHLSTTGGGNRTKVVTAFKQLDSLGFASYDSAHGTCGKALLARIKDLVGTHGATEQEINEIHSHIIASLV